MGFLFGHRSAFDPTDRETWGKPSEAAVRYKGKRLPSAEGGWIEEYRWVRFIHGMDKFLKEHVSRKQLTTLVEKILNPPPPRKKRIIDSTTLEALEREVREALNVEFECGGDLLFPNFHELRYKIWGKDHPFVQDDIETYSHLIRRLNQFRTGHFKSVTNENIDAVAEFYSKAAKTLYWMWQDSVPTEKLARKLELLAGAIKGNLSVKIGYMHYPEPHQCKCATADNEWRTLEQEMAHPRLPKPDCTHFGRTNGEPDDEEDEDGNFIPVKMPGLCNCLYHFGTIDLENPSQGDKWFLEAEAREEVAQKRRGEIREQMLAEGWEDRSEGWTDEFKRRMGKP